MRGQLYAAAGAGACLHRCRAACTLLLFIEHRITTMLEMPSQGSIADRSPRPLPSRARLRLFCPHCGRCKRGSTRWSYLQGVRLHLQSPKSSALFPDFNFFHCLLRSMHDVFGVPIFVAISSMYKVFPVLKFKQVSQAQLLFLNRHLICSTDGSSSS